MTTIPTEPGLYRETATDELLELRLDGLWYWVGRALPLGGLEFDDGEVRASTPDEIRSAHIGPMVMVDPV